jgi:hypothetical protein
VIESFGPFDTGAPERLLAALPPEVFSREKRTHVIAGGTPLAALDRALDPDSGARLLVLSRVGVHPDAKAPGLQALWRLEERARASKLPMLTLRLAPMIGPTSPLWSMLASGPKLPRAGRSLLNPVAEEDVVESITRAVDGRAKWEGWFEAAGSEVLSLAELTALARAYGPTDGFWGSWEPPAEEMLEHRLCESAPWMEHFQLESEAVAVRAKKWTVAARAAARNALA